MTKSDMETAGRGRTFYVRDAVPTNQGEDTTMADTTREMTLGELISLFYQEYMELYGDEELASVATAATINGMLVDGLPRPAAEQARPARRQAA